MFYIKNIIIAFNISGNLNDQTQVSEKLKQNVQRTNIEIPKIRIRF